jgi:hypothetical protein
MMLISSSFLVTPLAVGDTPPIAATTTTPATLASPPKKLLPTGIAIDLSATGSINYVFARLATGSLRSNLEEAAISDITTSEKAEKSNYLIITAIAERIAAAVVYKIARNPSWNSWRDVCEHELLDKIDLLALTTTRCGALSALVHCSLHAHATTLPHIATQNKVTSKSHFYGALYAMYKDSKLKLRDLIKQRLVTATNLSEVAQEAVALIRDVWETLAKDCSPILKDVIEQIKDKKNGKFKDAIEKYTKVIFEKYDLQAPEVSEDDAINAVLATPVVS